MYVFCTFDPSSILKASWNALAFSILDLLLIKYSCHFLSFVVFEHNKSQYVLCSLRSMYTESQLYYTQDTYTNSDTLCLRVSKSLCYVPLELQKVSRDWASRFYEVKFAKQNYFRQQNFYSYCRHIYCQYNTYTRELYMQILCSSGQKNG